jgi:curved DNA-binding protein CbpA
METLYDLLGALPTDDADGLRTAFRRAVKGAHPDLRPGDPDAALKFRQIVRANEILGDFEQRAAYDNLLELAHQEQEQAARQAVAARIHRVASGVMALAGVSAVTVGGYLLFMHMSAASVVPASTVEIAMRAPPEIAAVSTTGPPDRSDDGASSAKPESMSPPAEAIATGAAMPATDSMAVPAAADADPEPDAAASEARSLREQGLAAYRKGDLSASIADLDRALQLDPKYLPAYIDRGTILYRLRKFGHAFAGTVRAERLEKAGRSEPRAATAGKPRLEQAAMTAFVAQFSQRRAAAPDPSREEAAGSVRLR